jgi:hypothetical protein
MQTTSATGEDNTIPWWRDRRTSKGQNVTTTTGLCIENNMLLQCKHPTKGSKYMFVQVDDALVRCKKKFTKIKKKIMNFNRIKLQRMVI